MLKNHLQKTLFLLTILLPFLCVSNISANISADISADISTEEVKPLPNPHPVNELCNLWTIDQWEGMTHIEFEKKLLSLNLPISRREVTLVAIECSVFISNEMIRKAVLEIEKIREKR